MTWRKTTFLFLILGWFSVNVLAQTTSDDIPSSNLQYVETIVAASDCSDAATSSERNALADHCNTDYGYLDLVNQIQNPEMIMLYDAIDESQRAFFASDNTLGKEDKGYIAGCIAYSETLTYEQVMQVVALYRMDHPLYYWISENAFCEGQTLYLICYDSYADGQIRAELYDKIVHSLEEFEQYIEGSTEPYSIATASLYLLAQKVDYAYDESGVPETASWAHSIVGVVDEAYGQVVCEGYAKYYQMLMNYFGIPNVYVVGRANGNTGNDDEVVHHAWNLVQMDDGQYYWTDPTWSDVDQRNYYHNGTDPNHLADVENLDNCSDYPYRVQYCFHLKGDSFYQDHWPLTSENVGAAYMYDLPVAAAEAYIPTVEGIHLVGNPGEGYVITDPENYERQDISFNVVQNDGIHREVELDTLPSHLSTWDYPETITHEGVSYDVVGVNLSGVYWGVEEVVLPEGVRYLKGLINYDVSRVRTINIPSTVEYMEWPYLSALCLEEIAVADNHPYLKSVDGVLYSKNGKILIRYPADRPNQSYEIPQGVEYIYHDAFNGVKYLEELSIPDSVCRIGMYSFADTKALKELDIPSSVEELPGELFKAMYFGENDSIETIRISKNTKFEYNTFIAATRLKKLIIEEGNPWGYIYDGALYCMQMPLLVYGEEAVYDNVLVMYPQGASADTVQIKEDCTVVLTGVFSNGSHIGNVIIPDNCIADGCAFLQSKVESVTISENNPSFIYEDGAIYDSSRTQLYVYLGGCKNESFHIPEGVTSIMSFAFAGNEYIQHISMPDSVNQVLAGAFQNCSALEYVDLSDSIAWTEDWGNDSIFEGCTNLKEITMPAASTHVPSWMFHLCTSLKKLVLHENIKTIGEGSLVMTNIDEIFVYGDELSPYYGDREDFLIGYGIGDLREDCGKIRTIIYSSPDFNLIKYIQNEENFEYTWRDISQNVDDLPSEGQCGDNLHWQFSDGVLSVSGSGDMYNYLQKGAEAPWLWRWGNEIECVVIEDGVTSIGAGAFYNCTNLKTLEMADTVQVIDSFAFSRCESLENVQWSKGLKTIGRSAFNTCRSLKSIDLPFGSSVGFCTFKNCIQLKEVVIPNGTKDLLYTFAGCTNLERITIYHSVEMVNFPECKSLKEIYLSHNITEGLLNCLFAYDVLSDCEQKPTIYGCLDAPTKAYAEKNGYTFVDIHDDEKCQADNHTKDEIVAIVEPQCLEAGYTTYFCSMCGQMFNDDYTSPVGHTINEWVEGDLVERWCIICGETWVSEPEATKPTEPEETKPTEPEETKPTEPEETEPTEPSCEHKWSQWKITNPTSKKEGLRTRKCEICGEEESEVLSKLSGKFKDVPETQYYALPVDWAVQKGVTTGMSETSFAPDAECTRGQIVTFLWRAAGEPEPSSSVNPFKDVKSGDYFYKAVLWAVEEGITTGTGADTFSPASGCTRAQVATFLWRSQGKPAAASKNPFADVKQGEYFYEAVIWAVENGVTTGTSATTFAPNATCTRGQIVTFLYRAIA